MLFTLLVFLAAFALEAIGSYTSIVGLAALFASNIVVIVLAGCLDFAKIITVSFLYKHWKELGWIMRSYLTIASMVLMIITSAGAFGFLSGQFQKAIQDTGTQAIKIQSLTDEQGRLQKRKEEIDNQIAKVPDNNVRGRTQLIRQFGPEVSKINARLTDIDKELPTLKIENVDKETHAGPILYVAKAFNKTPEEAVKYVIFTIIFVFDPLAVALLIAGNFLLAQRKQKENIPTPMMEHINIGDQTFNIDNTSNEEEVKKVYDAAFEKVHIPDHDREDTTRMFETLRSEPSPEAQAFYDSINAQVEKPESKITANEMELVPIEELQTPELDPNCRYCGGDGEHYIGPSQYVPCNACTPDEGLKSKEQKETTESAPAIPTKQVTMKEKDGRDVISLTVPRSLLEDVNIQHADITDATQYDLQTIRLREHYADESKFIEPVVVGNFK